MYQILLNEQKGFSRDKNCSGKVALRHTPLT